MITVVETGKEAVDSALSVALSSSEETTSTGL